MHETRGNPMWRLQQKLKLLSKALSHWSKEVVGDVFRNISEWETEVQRLEEISLATNDARVGKILTKHMQNTSGGIHSKTDL